MVRIIAVPLPLMVLSYMRICAAIGIAAANAQAQALRQRTAAGSQL